MSQTTGAVVADGGIRKGIGGGVRTLALAGNPNSGKTTLFNALTGLRQKVANYPGVTVEKKTGRVKLGYEVKAEVVDLPGTYSLVSRSPDERVACEVLRGLRADTPPPDVVVAVVDASNLSRNLYLVSQLLELGRPMVVALTMMDVAQRRGLVVHPAKLEAILGVPVVGIVGHKGEGVDELKRRLSEAKVPAAPGLVWPASMAEELGRIVQVVGGGAGGRAIGERLLIGDATDDLAPLAGRADVRDVVSDALARLQAKGIDPIQADVEAHYAWIDSVVARVSEGGDTRPSSAAAATPAGGGVGLSSVQRSQKTLHYATRSLTFTDRLDRVLIHKVWGLIVFAAVMAALFVSVFTLAAPLMDATEGLVTWAGGLVTGLLPEGPVRDLWADGIVAGVGAVVVFVPQIAILFAFLAILEDSGYLARAAFLMDRLLRGVGLSGKSFIPLLSSFACAIPGIMATRTIESKRQRMATLFVAPFMSCSARLPVYTLLIGAFFATSGAVVQAGVMLGLYLLGILAAVATAWGMQRWGGREASTGGGGFLLELPTYKLPQASQVARQIWSNTAKFVTKAGTIIFCLSVVLWAMTYYPRLPEERAKAVMVALDEERASVVSAVERGVAVEAGPRDKWLKLRSPYPFSPATGDTRSPFVVRELDEVAETVLASEQLRHSIAGRMGHLMEPAIAPLGYDWKMGVGLVSAFAAREVFVSTMGIVYSAGDTEESTDSLAEAMRADRYADGRPVWTVPVAASLLVWFVLAMQCMSTLAIVRRETASWRWPVVMLVYMIAVAYVGALVTYQVLSRVLV